MQQSRLRPEPRGTQGRSGPELDFQRTVSRRLVHRAAVAEVFVTDALVLGEDRFLVGGQWPRDHALYHPDAQRGSDPLLFAETVRQALVYLAHWHYEIPLGHRFVGYDMDFEITDPVALRVGGRPVPVELDASWEWTDRRPPRRYGARLEVTLSVGGRACGRGSLRIVALDERSYRIIRGPQGGACAAPVAVEPRRRVEPALVGRLRNKDSVLAAGPSPAEWLLQPDLDHAILFDHPTDHLPLMVLLEGFRQLGHLMTCSAAPRPEGRAPALVSAAVDCLAFAELDVPTRLCVREDRTVDDVSAGDARTGRRLLRLDALQGDTLVASCASVWAPVSLATATGRPGGQSVSHA
ncbi:ScbA/BarX family gamma-butyrolactone biosynthesis protein [Streptomyces griseoincarnatus]